MAAISAVKWAANEFMSLNSGGGCGGAGVAAGVVAGAGAGVTAAMVAGKSAWYTASAAVKVSSKWVFKSIFATAAFTLGGSMSRQILPTAVAQQQFTNGGSF